VLAAAFALAPTPPAGSQPQRHPYTQPHVLRYATASDISGLNPHLNEESELGYLSSLTMAWLLKTGPHNELLPELATEVPSKANGGITPDGRTITYHLRRGVRWSDGAPFDADDVVFSIKTVLNPATNEVSRDGWDRIVKIDEPDKYTVVLHLKERYSTYAYTFFSTTGANPCVLPKHLLGGLANINSAPYNDLPVGIGPFRYVAWHRGDSVEMEANPYYFRGLPKLQRIVYKIVPDRNTMLTQLQTHELDLWLPVPAAYYERLRALSGLRVYREPSFAYDHVDFNLSHPVVADLAVREALRYALDRETIRVKIRHGVGLLSDNIFGPNHPDYHPIPLVPFDLARARAILDQAGWKPGPDGIRAKNGVRLALTFVIVSGSPDTDAIVELIRGTWSQIGVALDVRRYPSSLLFATAAQNGILDSGKFDVALTAWGLDNSGDVSDQFACASIPPAGQNHLHFCDPEADRAMTAFTLEYDMEKRKPLDYLATDRIASQVPSIVLDIRDWIFAYNGDLENFHPNGSAAFDNMMDVDI